MGPGNTPGNPTPEPLRKVSDGAWLVRRWLPALLLAAGTGAGLGWLRASLFFFPGIQGMAAGGALGWAIGRLGRADAPRHWTLGQRIWLSLAMILVFGTGHLGTLSLCLAGPLDPPLYWLFGVMDGSAHEPFLGLARFTTHSGFLEGGWWVGLNLLDLLLFAFLFIVSMGVGRSPDRPGEIEGEDEQTEVETGPELPAEPPGSRCGLFGCLGLAALLAVGGFAYYNAVVKPEPRDLSRAGLERLEPLAGAWIVEDGAGLFGPKGKASNIAIEAGFGSLRLRPDDGRPGESSPADVQALLRGERGETWRLNLERNRGNDFSGLLFFYGPGHKGRMPVSVRARFSGDGERLTLAWSHFSPSGRREVTVRGIRPSQR